MVGIVGYTLIGHKKNERILEAMVGAIKHFDDHAVDKFYGKTVHIGRVHLAVFNEDGSLDIVVYGKAYNGFIKNVNLGTVHQIKGDIGE